MMKILLVEDDPQKARNIANTLAEAGIDPDKSIDMAVNGAQALELLRTNNYQLLILDLLLPMRLQEEPSPDGGKRLLEAIVRQPDILRPEHIVGLTASEEAKKLSQNEFGRGLWTIARYGHDTVEWKDSLTERARYILARQSSNLRNLTYDYDVLFVCALRTPELSQLKLATGTQWTTIESDEDPTSYFETTIPNGNNGCIRAVACSAPSMGLAPAASLTTKACLRFRPKFVFMTGICGGRKGDVDLGNIVVASTTWDYGNGKFVGENDTLRFQASPYQLPIDPVLSKSVEAVTSDLKMITEIDSQFTGKKPTGRPSAVFAPMTSGAAVQANSEFFDSIAGHHRKVVAVDMEAFGVAWATRETPEPRPRACIVKAVSDFADEEKSDDVQDYCSFVSARVAIEIAKRVV
ncbi:MAG: response regulator [Rhodobacteraceae bacterium]|nr:response regulator [Paracoccaceae bacterium]